MNLFDFDPDGVLLVDGYALVKAAFPGINVHSVFDSRKALNKILEQVTFDPWFNVGTPNAGWWYTVVPREDLDVPFEFEHIVNSYALNLLDPVTGYVFVGVRKTDIVSTFWVNGSEHAAFADGVVVRLIPSLDPRFHTHLEFNRILRRG